jgi:hypothetical protein
MIIAPPPGADSFLILKTFEPSSPPNRDDLLAAAWLKRDLAPRDICLAMYFAPHPDGSLSAELESGKLFFHLVWPVPCQRPTISSAGEDIAEA